MMPIIRSLSDYKTLYEKSLNTPSEFWAEIAQSFEWRQPWDRVGPSSFSDSDQSWFSGAQLNITDNALDRHVQLSPDRLALLWEPQNPNREARSFTYKELSTEVHRVAKMLQELGVKKHDTVGIFLPMIPEAVFSLLACARLGAVHVVIFAGFSAEAVVKRLRDTNCTYVITADGAVRGEKIIPLKQIIDRALAEVPQVKTCVVIQQESLNLQLSADRDFWWHELLPQPGSYIEAIATQAEDHLFILHTSGSTGEPKGLVHSTAGYMVYAEYSFRTIFRYQPSQLYWCTADLGWITGHTYGVYGPLLAGATMLMTEGSFLFPKPERFCEIIEKYRVNILYTSPTVLRILAQQPRQIFSDSDLSSLQVLGSVGEPLDATTWEWYSTVLGRNICPVIDTWWQTETGGILIGSPAGLNLHHPAVAGLPLPGILPQVLSSSGTSELVIQRPWPGLATTIYGNHQRFLDTYFPTKDGGFSTKDQATIDSAGLVQFHGRNDDVINVSGHRISSAEVERVLMKHSSVAEAAVVGIPDPITHEALSAFVVIRKEQDADIQQNLLIGLNALLHRDIGRFVTLKEVHLVRELPKTRSGKILRRFLRKICLGEEIEDAMIASNPESVKYLQTLD